jgi:thioredoxin-dependent peroxiredoxin
MIDEGDKLPAFRLPDQNGKVRTLASLTGPKGLVLYAYPKDNTPGCTTEARDFRNRIEDFADKGFKIAGVSQDSAASHCDFIAANDLNFPLLTDADGGFLDKIGAYGEKKLYGRTTQGILRTTFVVDKQGRVVKVFRNVRAKGHAERVLGEL